jgi:hypothetical protein
VLTPGVGGGIEAVDALIASYVERLGLRGWDVWHHDKLCRLIDSRPQLQSYAALITPSTLIAQLLERITLGLAVFAYAYAPTGPRTALNPSWLSSETTASAIRM